MHAERNDGADAAGLHLCARGGVALGKPRRRILALRQRLALALGNGVSVAHTQRVGLARGLACGLALAVAVACIVALSVCNAAGFAQSQPDADVIGFSLSFEIPCATV
jgi:hypothetical protein